VAEPQARRSGAAGLSFVTRNIAMADTPDPNLVRRIEEACANLPRLQREIYLAYRLDGLAYCEIAARTGLSVRRVERHIGKAIYKIGKQVLRGQKLSWWERRF
jgi:DNA-directed RNA polymerase specialized sigma24 family protein